MVEQKVGKTMYEKAPWQFFQFKVMINSTLTRRQESQGAQKITKFFFVFSFYIILKQEM